MNYTRKRALLACDFCRHRKRRCDGERPCSTCRESNADCRYKDLPVERVDSPTSSSEALAERLTRIEALLEHQGQQLNDLVHVSGAATHQTTTFALPPLYLPPELASHSPASVSVRSSQGLETPGFEYLTQFLIPREHSTAANTLLSLPQVRYLVGEYPRTYFADIEQALPLPPQLDYLHATPPVWPALNPPLLDTLAENYYAVVHPNHPLFNRQVFQQWKMHVYEHGLSDTMESAICCCVWALGAMVCKDDAFTTPPEQLERDELALNFFQPALRLILHRSTWSFKPNLEICQALLLAATFFSHTGRPLHNAKMVNLASNHFLQLLDERKREGVGSEYDDTVLRLFWACFMMECDRAAELEIPRSGVEPMADKMPLPRSLDPTETDDMIYFVAETAVRRLLNRIHSSLYAPDNTDMAEGAVTPNNISLNKMLSLSSELDRQLQEWYFSIPFKLRPPIGTEPIASYRGRVLRIRYYAARHIIHRPFVLSVALQQMRLRSSASGGGGGPSSSSSQLSPQLHQPPPPPPPLPLPPQPPHPSTPAAAAAVAAASVAAFPVPRVVLEKCETCINACTTYLYNVVGMLDRRSPYMWSFSQSCMACLLVLLVADSCPQLRPFTPDIKPLQALVVLTLKRWATPGSSFEAEVKILESFRFLDSF